MLYQSLQHKPKAFNGVSFIVGNVDIVIQINIMLDDNDKSLKRYILGVNKIACTVST